MLKDADINQRIQRVYIRLSKGHKKIANAILYNHEKTAYMTAERLANFANVSESTVIRFANELGYEGYAEFQRASQELVRTKLTPNQRIELSKQMMQGSDITDKVMSSDIAKIRRTFEQLDRLTFSSAVSLKKAFSGHIGTNLLEIDFSTEQVNNGEEYALLSKLRKSEIKDADARAELYSKIIENLEIEGSYLILLAHDACDIFETNAEGEKDYESTSVYSYVICAICPVKEGKPTISYY